MHTSVASTPQLRRLGFVTAVAGAALICVATLIPQAGELETSPFCVICGELGGVNALLNVLLFVPLGAGLALSGMRAKNAVLAMILFSAAIEVAQFTVVAGRDATLGDVIANSVGGALGFALPHIGGDLLRPTRRMAFGLTSAWSLGWLALQAICNYAFLPDFPPAHYYGQIARSFENMATFEGRVLSATIDTVVVPDVGYAKSEQLREMLLQRSVVAATVVPVQPTSAVAPIIRVDTKGREIVLLAQDGRDLLFEVRTAAVRLRVRPPIFILHAAFPDSIPGLQPAFRDTVRLAGRYGVGRVDMSAEFGSSLLERRLPVSQVLAWTLVSPNRWYISDSLPERLITWVSVGLLVFPLGYWGTFARYRTDLSKANDSRDTGRWTILALGAAGILLLGLVAIPLLFGLPAVSAGGLVAGLTGLGLGWVGALVAKRHNRHDARAVPRDGLTL